jgi:DNA-binding IscR family transcriptional regulator
MTEQAKRKAIIVINKLADLVPIDEIAKRHGVSVAYLRKLLREWRKHHHT